MPVRSCWSAWIAILNDVSGAILKIHNYDHDAAGNRTSEAIDNLVTGDTLTTSIN